MFVRGRTDGFFLHRPQVAAAAASGGRENLLSIRTYDVIITFVALFSFVLFGSKLTRRFSCLAGTTSTTKLRESGFSATTRFVPIFHLLPSHTPLTDLLLLSTYLQNKTPLTPVQTFQDIPADHAHKTVTMETFPHSGTPLASVHPCKHASVMKKVIEKMGAAAGEEQRRALGQDQAGGSLPASTSTSSGKEKKKGLFGGAIRKVTGGGASSAASAGPEAAAEGAADDGGLQVDYYLVIVGSSCIPRGVRGEHVTDHDRLRPIACRSSSSSSPLSYRPSRSTRRPRSERLAASDDMTFFSRGTGRVRVRVLFPPAKPFSFRQNTQKRLPRTLSQYSYQGRYRLSQSQTPPRVG